MKTLHDGPPAFPAVHPAFPAAPPAIPAVQPAFKNPNNCFLEVGVSNFQQSSTFHTRYQMTRYEGNKVVVLDLVGSILCSAKK